MDVNTPPGCNNSSPNNSFNNKFKYSKYIFIIVTVFLSILGIVFFVLPALFLCLSSVWPNIFTNVNLIAQLKDNLDSAVGIMSLALSSISIWLSFKSDKAMKIQRAEQDAFLRDIAVKIDNIQKEIIVIEKNIDITKDVDLEPLKEETEAKEE